MSEIKRNLEERRKIARSGGGPKRIAAQHAKGKLTARERIDLLLDEDSLLNIELQSLVCKKIVPLEMVW